ncbi:MAG: cation:proton antiporter [Bryobacteraceae bacterium]
MGIAQDFVLIIVVGLLGGILARALRLPLLVGYVAAGVVVGPYTAGPTVGQIHDIELLAEIGVALLLFSLGLEISFRDLQPVRRIALLGGPLQVLFTGGAGALAARHLLGMATTEAIWFGAMVSVSSTMVVLKILSAGGVTTTLASRVMIGLLVVQDMAVIPMLIVLPQLGGAPETILPNLAKSLAVAAIFLAAVYFIGTLLLPRFLKTILTWGSQELFLVAVVAIGVGVGYATHLAGMSFALGAFVAGIILSESEFSHQALSDIVPLRDIFGLLFFVSVGMLFDPQFAVANAALIAATVAAIFAGKALLTGGIARAFGYTNMAPWIVGLGLAQIGEFSFVLARTGVTANLLSKQTYNLALTCTVLTMALSPLVSAAALPLGRLWRRWRRPAPSRLNIKLPAEALTGHVILAGYGRTGRTAARALRAAGIPVLIVEFNHSLFEDLSAAGFPGIWGDITRPEILHAARVEFAKILLVTFPDQTLIHLTVQNALHSNSSLTVIARAAHQDHIAALLAHGVNVAVQPEIEGGIEMVRQALTHCRHSPEITDPLIASLREEIYRPS